MHSVQWVILVGLVCCTFIIFVSAEPNRNYAEPQNANAVSNGSHSIQVITHDTQTRVDSQTRVVTIPVNANNTTKSRPISGSLLRADELSVQRPRTPVAKENPTQKAAQIQANRERNYAARIKQALGRLLPDSELLLLAGANSLIKQITAEVLQLCGSVEREEIPPTPFIDCHLIMAVQQAQCRPNEEQDKSSEEVVTEILLEEIAADGNSPM